MMSAVSAKAFEEWFNCKTQGVNVLLQERMFSNPFSFPRVPFNNLCNLSLNTFEPVLFTYGVVTHEFKLHDR